MIVVILGPDGSGKSTIADILVNSLKADGVRARHYAHRFGVLPPLSSLRLNRKRRSPLEINSATDGTPSYDLNENSPLRAFVYVTWYGVDYLLGGLWLRLRNTFGKDRIVGIFARYFYDYYYQSNNRRLPDSIKRVIEVLVPRPRFIFFLYRDAQEIHAAKPELPVAEIEKQQRIILEKMAAYPQFRVIYARNGAQDTAQQIHRILRDQAG